MSLQSILSTGAESTEPGAEYVVLGGGHVGAKVTSHLRAAGHAVTVVDETHDPADSSGVRGDPTDRQTLERAGITDAATVVVAMPRDRQSLLVADVRVLVQSPDRCDLVADAGHEPICATTALSDAIVADVERLYEVA